MTRTSRRLRNSSTETPSIESNGKNALQVNAFVEPELSDSIIVTGQKMEEPPTVKVKKEFGVFSKGSKKGETQSPDIIECLKNYKSKLKSHEEVEQSTVLSTMRNSLNEDEDNEKIMNKSPMESNPSSPSSESSSLSSSPMPTLSLSLSPKKVMKRKYSKKKHIDTKRSLLDKINQTMIENMENSDSQHTEESNTETPPLNNDYCSCCGMTGMFLCCESCPKSYHFQCIIPPVDPNNLPDFWYCRECIKKKSESKSSNNNNNNNKQPISLNVGIFAKLFDGIIFQDPISFQLPKEIIESFESLSSDRLGDYNDDSFKQTKTYKQLVKESDDPTNGLYDKDNNPYFCYKCGESGFKKEIMKCDYCSLCWHLDCLEEPMSSVKKLGSKWKCPNHVDDLADRPIRKFKNQEIIPITNMQNFELSGKLPINANIEIVNIEDKMKSMKEKIKELHNNNNGNLKYSNLTFKLSEENIILDFINSNKIKKINDNEKSFQTLMNLEPSLKDYVTSLSELSGRSILDDNHRNINFQKLLQVSNDEMKVLKNDFDESELSELLSIKRLLELKGKDKLLKFLKS